MNYKYLYCQKMIECDGGIWFCPGSHNGLYRLSKDDGKARLMARIPGEELAKPNLYRAAVSYQKKIILVPWNAREIAVYYLDSAICRKLTLDSYCNPNGGGKFYEAFSYGKYAWFLGTVYPVIVRMDMDTEEMVYFSEWADWLKGKGTDYLYLSDYVIRGKYAFCSYCYEDAVLKIDLQDGGMETIPIGSGVSGFYGMADDREDIWFSPTHGREFVQWNPDTGHMTKHTIPYSGDDVDFPFHVPLVDEDKIYIMPFFGKAEVFAANRQNHILKKDGAFTDVLERSRNGKSVGVVTETACLAGYGKMFYINGADFSWHVYDTSTHEDTCQYVELEESDRESLFTVIMRERLGRGEIVGENKDFRLGGFLNNLAGT